MLKKLGLKENESINHPWINKAIESAQKKVEARNFDIRKTLIKFDDVMNDQRQVIFSQRYKILKEEKLEETLKSFFEEQMKNTLLAKSDYSKSKDEKAYLASMKSLTGNAFLDKELVEFANLNDPDFSTKLNEKYKSNKNDRINTIGQEQNDDLEKKIALLLIDNLESSGFLKISLRDFSFEIGINEEIVNDILVRLKKFDPVGVFSQSLEECFFLQLEDRKLLNKGIKKLINNLEILASGEIRKLSKICKTDESEIYEMLKND